MTVTLPSDVQKFVEEQIAAGAYATAEDVLRAAVASLSIPHTHGDFEPGELDAILERATKRYRENGGRPADEVFDRLESKIATLREQAT